jgi:hypothetical protein
MNILRGRYVHLILLSCLKHKKEEEEEEEVAIGGDSSPRQKACDNKSNDGDGD